MDVNDNVKAVIFLVTLVLIMIAVVILSFYLLIKALYRKNENERYIKIKK